MSRRGYDDRYGGGGDSRDHRRSDRYSYGDDYRDDRRRGGGGGYRDDQRYGDDYRRRDDGERRYGGGGGGSGRYHGGHGDGYGRGNQYDYRGGRGGGSRNDGYPPAQDRGGRYGSGFDDRRGGGGGSYGGDGGGDYSRGGGDSYDGRGRGGGYRDGRYDDRRGSYDGGRSRGGGGRFQGDRRGSYDGGRGRGGGGRGRGGFSRAPVLAPGKHETLTNIIPAKLSQTFEFYAYHVESKSRDGTSVDSKFRRAQLFSNGLRNGPLKDLTEKEQRDIERFIFLTGMEAFSPKKIPGLTQLPVTLCDGSKTDGDTLTIEKLYRYSAPQELYEQPKETGPDEMHLDLRCKDCLTTFDSADALASHVETTGHSGPAFLDEKPPEHASMEHFLTFLNLALARALAENLARWGRTFVDPNKCTTPTDREGRELGVMVFRAYDACFGVGRLNEKERLIMTVDLRAKIIRTKTVLDAIYEGRDPNTTVLSEGEKRRLQEYWGGQVVINKNDKSCYFVHALVFDHSCDSMQVDGLGMSHTEYYKKRKNCELEYPNVRPIVAVLGRKDTIIHLPAEIICGNELDPQVTQKLPQIASFGPEERSKATDELTKFFKPGAQRKNMLPSIGVNMEDGRATVPAVVLPTAVIQARGIKIPPNRSSNWAPELSRAKFHANGNEVLELNVAVVYHRDLRGDNALRVYEKVRGMVNRFEAKFRFPSRPHLVEARDDKMGHVDAVRAYLADTNQPPANLFVLDFTKPSKKLDDYYPVVKKVLATGGYLSQFINFKNHDHTRPARPGKKDRSPMILDGCARQVLSKCGATIWWTTIPQSIPLPLVLVGIDVFHTPKTYDPVTRQRSAKASCAGVVVQVIRKSTEDDVEIESYSQAFRRTAGEEYDLRSSIEETLSNAMRTLKVTPQSCVVYRDGVGDGAIDKTVHQEVVGIRRALGDGENVDNPKVHMAYVVCQKRIGVKFITTDGKHAMPPGTVVEELDRAYNAFYIQGTAPPYSTSKPVRFVVPVRDPLFQKAELPQLTWNLMHEYPNWTGPIKVPSVTQLAHKLSEHVGGFSEACDQIDSDEFRSRYYYL